MARWVVGVVVAIVAALLAVLSPADATHATPALTTYTYDGHRHTVAAADTTTERGPPSAYDPVATHNGADVSPHGASKRTDGLTPAAIHDYNHLAPYVQPVGDAATTEGQPRRPGREISTLPPATVAANNGPVVFGQARIGPKFSTKAEVPGHLSGRPLADVSAELCAGTMSPDAIPITAFEHGGQLVTANNRGLAALSDAGLMPTNLTVVDKSSLPADVMARLGETPTALGTGLPSPSIAVTPSRSDWTVLRTISVPGFG